jgi:hypothetical protein
MDLHFAHTWLRRGLYAVLAFSSLMWFITLASGPAIDIGDVIRIEAAKSRYFVAFVLCLTGLALSTSIERTKSSLIASDSPGQIQT